MIQIPDSVRGFVFDCDGTLADTMPLHYKAWVVALKEYGASFPEAMFWELAGTPTPKIIEAINQRYGFNVPVVEGAHRKEELFEQMIPQLTAIEPVVALVHQYAGKLPMAVATGGTRAICTKTLQALDLLKYFDAIVTADDVEHGKPAPDIFLGAALRLNVPPEFCYAFEDAELGLQSARSAGMTAIDIRPFRKG